MCMPGMLLTQNLLHVGHWSIASWAKWRESGYTPLVPNPLGAKIDSAEKLTLVG